MTQYYVFRPFDGLERYWTGGFTLAGEPERTIEKRKAKTFSSAREAYQAAGVFTPLQYWRVGRR